MKRPITNLVMGWLALFLSIFQLNAQTTFAVDPQNVTGAPGDQITVDFIVDDFTNILNFQYSMTWDPSIIEWVGPVVVSGNLNGLSATSSFGTNNAGNGTMSVSWLDPDVAGVTLDNGTLLYSLTFDVLSSDGTEIEFGSVPTVIEVIDGDGNPLQFAGQPGIVNGGSGGSGSGDDLIVTIDQTTGASGSNVCLDFSVQNFDDIQNMQYSMHFNSSVIEYTGADMLNLPGLVASNFGTNNAGTGTVTLSWLDPDVAGVTVPDGTVIYQMCFDIIGSSGQTSNITIDGVPTIIEVIDGSNDPVNLVTLPGSVTVSGGSPPPPPPVDGFAIIASDQTVETGNNFCVEFSVQDFDNILSMQYTMEYDETQLEFTGVQNLNLDGLSSAMINLFAPGIIAISWLDPDVAGETVADGVVIYEICFNAIGANNCNNSNQLTFSGSQAPIEVLDGNEDMVDFNSVPGVTSICDDPNGGGGGGGGTPTNMTFTASSTSALPGDNFCVDVSTDLFDCVVSAQFSMHFDPTVLQFTEVDNLNLPGLVSAQFGTVAAANGTVTFSWLDPDVAGVTVPNGTVIFSVCFNVVGDLGDSSPFTFDNNPTVIEITDCNPTNPNPDFVAGVETIEVSCPGPVNITNAVTNDIDCFGLTTGSIDISVSGGDGAYVFAWTNADGDPVGTDEDLAFLPPGTYTVLVSSCNGNETATESYIIGQPGSGININGSATPIICFGDETGTIDISASGGTVGGGCSYTYLWNTGATTEDLSNLGGGTYVVTVTDCSNCEVTASYSILGPPSELTISSNVTTIQCNGECNGSISIIADGGFPPYQYMLNSGAFSGIKDYNNLCAGSYFVKVRDAFGCVVSTQILVSAPPALGASATTTSAVNGNDGAVDLSVSGGTPQYTYNWEGPNGYTAITQDIDNLLPGDYCVTITDNNNCETNLCENIQAPLVLSGINSTPTCFGQCIGQLEVNFTGGTAPYTYAWSPAGGNDSITPANLCPGSYIVTITSFDGQTATMSADVEGPQSAITIMDDDLTHVSEPGECDGEINLDVVGGYGGYAYEWSNGSSLLTGNPVTVCEGNYTVTVTDINGCSVVGGAAPNDPYEIFFIPDPLVLTVAGSTICVSDLADGGTLTIVVQGGLPPYNFTFTNGLDPVLGYTENQLILTGVPPGDYTITVTDSVPVPFDQEQDMDATVELIDMELDPVVITPVTNGGDGAIDITVTGGVPIHNYTWNVAPIDAQDQSDLSPGTYEVYVTDANGCIELFGGYEINEFLANGVRTNTSCPGDNNGSIVLNATGSPNTPYTYLWDTDSTDAMLADLELGEYTVTITDANGNFIVETFIIQSESNLNATVIQEGDILCFGGSTGVAVAYPVDGVDPYSYDWSNGGSNQMNADLTAGIYTVTITDGVGCTVIKEVNIIEPPLLDLTVFVDDAKDCTEGNGTAEAMITGGVQPFTYLWDDPLSQTSKKAILLDPDAYTVVVTDDNGCTGSGFGVVEPVDPLVVVGVSVPDSGGPNGQAIAVVESGTYPYSFEWRDDPSIDSVLTELLPNFYYVKVTDAKGCESLVEIKVEDETTCLMASAIITPEGDGFNEEFQIGCLSRYPDNRLEIYNRWGQMIFLANDYNNADLWRGTNRRGTDAPDGVYFYVFEYVDPVTGIEDSLKGAVTVARK